MEYKKGPNGEVFGELACSSACLMVRKVEMEPDVVVLLRSWREERSFIKTYGNPG
jgi:hypothetical protein